MAVTRKLRRVITVEGIHGQQPCARSWQRTDNGICPYSRRCTGCSASAATG